MKENTEVNEVNDEARLSRMTREDRRQQLIKVSIRLFSEKGFTGTKTKEIARAAGVTEALIFRHFATKDDLYAAILDYKANQAHSALWITELRDYANTRDDEKLIHTLCKKIIQYYRSDRDFLRLMFYSALEEHKLVKSFQESFAKPICDFLTDYISERQREGEFLCCNPRAAVRAFIGMSSHHAVFKELLNLNEADISDEEASTTFSKIFLDGIRHASTKDSHKKNGRQKK